MKPAEVNVIRHLTHFSIVVLLIIAVLALSGCVTSEPAVTLHPRADADDFFAKLNENFNSIQSMKAVASVIYSAPEEGADSLRAIMAYRCPGKLRIKGYKPYTPTLFDFLLEEDTWRLYLPGEKRALEGDLDELRKLGGPWHAIAAVTAGLLGQLFEVSAPEIEGFVKGEQEWMMTVSLAPAGGERYLADLYFDPGDIRIKKQVFIDPGDVVFAEVAFRDYRSYDGVWFPRKWELILTPTQERLRVSIGKLDMGAELEDSVFEILLPRTVEVERVR